MPQICTKSYLQRTQCSCRISTFASSVPINVEVRDSQSRCRSVVQPQATYVEVSIIIYHPINRARSTTSPRHTRKFPWFNTTGQSPHEPLKLHLSTDSRLQRSPGTVCVSITRSTAKRLPMVAVIFAASRTLDAVPVLARAGIAQPA